MVKLFISVLNIILYERENREIGGERDPAIFQSYVIFFSGYETKVI